MNIGRCVFDQLMDFVPSYEFQKCVQQYNGNYGGPDFEELYFLEENFAQIVLAGC